MLRKAAVAGMFYQGDKILLLNEIEQSFTGPLGPGTLPKLNQEKTGKVIGLVCPHAGYMYSGSAAAHAYYALAESGMADVAVILGPNHYGLGSTAALASETMWSTPLGSVSTDKDTSKAILDATKWLREDDSAHFREHSIEVQLPFLQYISSKAFKIVPISISHCSESDAHELINDLAPAIANAIKEKNAIIIASTDLTHYETKKKAASQDALVIERAINLDSHGLVETVYKNSISMCGVIGTAIMLEACSILGAESGHNLAYYTSGDITGDNSQVVGYVGMSIEY